MQSRSPRRVGALVAVGAGALVSVELAAQAVDPTDYEHLVDPRIAERPAETMLVVQATGDPNQVGDAAFGYLFQLYFSIPNRAGGFIPPIPRARWPVDLTTPPDTWIGHYGVSVPEGSGLSGASAPEGMSASVTTWEYGEVAEILHVGPYDQEQPTFDRLLAFVEAQGYVTIGGHEEEYVRGPTMAGPGDPTEYLTILRYRVRKR
ncbi:MAG: GyrI-like domain-containing protein [Gemmatimonadetes bacterium]|nr:GyrI-like domain-containing protein [Gemmatimonadota bacterium]